MLVYLSLLVAIIGLLFIGFSTPPQTKLLLVGEITYLCGLLAFLINYTKIVRF